MNLAQDLDTFSTPNYDIKKLVSRKYVGDLILNPKAPFVEGVIDLLLAGVQMPVVYVAEDCQGKFTVVAGNWICSAIQFIMSPQFQELSRSAQRRIEETRVVLSVIRPGTTPAASEFLLSTLQSCEG